MVDRDIINLYHTLSAMKDRNFSITELENMIPFEFDVFISIEENKIKEEKERLEQKK